MSWVAIAVGVGGAAISAGTQMYSSSQKDKAAKKAQSAVTSANLGKVPEAALYQPVDFNQEQLNGIFANSNALPFAQNLVRGTNNFITADALHRANKLIPGYSSSMRQMGMNANDLINGRLPSDVIQKLVSDRAGVSNGVNIPGLAGSATLKDLGLTSLDGMNQGTGLLGKMVQMAETVSPRASYMNPQASMVSPADRIRLAMDQNTLMQQSEQNANNLAAGANPADLARVGVQLGNPGGSGVNWGAVGGSVAQGLLGALQKNNTGTSGGYDASTGYYSNPAALTNAYATPGYRPVYGQDGSGYYFQSYEPLAA